MTSRSLKEISDEIKEVDERIYSKIKLLNEYPNDLGLKLSLMDFEGRKKDLIRELTEAKSIYNIVSFDLSLYALNKEPITLNVLGDISNKFDNLIRAFLMTIGGPIKKRTSRIKKMFDIDQYKLQVDYVETGSLIITLSEAGNLQHFEKSPLNDALIKLNDLIDCGDNKELIINKKKTYGNKPIYNYKEFLDVIQKNGLDLKLYEYSKPKNFKTKKITNRFAKSVFKVIDEAEEVTTKKINIEGIVYYANTDSLIFGIKTPSKKYRISFDSKFKRSVKSNLDDKVKAQLEKIIEPHEVEGDPIINYKLIRFVYD
ncbi:MAG: hypothetical protein FGO69_09635 [Methanobacterium sp.]|nr:MAG: hypothetical protein FGO69_09635 [Methanobacterium sp.]